ncbi:hypothetical protein A2U01_0065370, partial [Trifolium medium]|nr:hypothetical protein [Trifolium medium]
ALMHQEANKMQQEANRIALDKANTKKMELYLKLTSEEHLDDRKEKLLKKLEQELFNN